MTTRSHPSDLDEDFAFLAKAAEILFDMEESHRRLAMSEKRDALRAAERDVSLWEQRQQAQILKCPVVARCANLRCRRQKSCTTLRWISGNAAASRLRLAAEQEKWPACDHKAALQPQEGKKKGRTGVRP